jgi:hypothetical protein
VRHTSLPFLTLPSITERRALFLAAEEVLPLPLDDTALSFHRRRSSVANFSRAKLRLGRSIRLRCEPQAIALAEDGLTVLVREIPLAPELLFRGKQGWSHEQRAQLGSALARWAKQSGVDTTGGDGGDGGASPSDAVTAIRSAALVARIAVRLR